MKAADRAERDNAWLAAQLRELAARLDLDEVPHRPRAYRRAAETIEQLGRPIGELYEAEGAKALEALPGIGPHIARIVGELLETGRAPPLERLRKKAPVDVMGLLSVEGVGIKTVKLLWQELRVKTLEELERALSEGRVQGLPGFGPRRQERLRRAVQIRQRGGSRVARKRALPIAQRLRDALASHPSAVECAIAGSLRRGLSTIGDIDLVVASDDPESVARVLLERPEVEYVYSGGPARVSVRLKEGVDVDLRTVAPECFGSALLYFTGSRAHNLALRRLALAEGLRLNEYGLFRGRARIAGRTEEELYEALALPYMPPERRLGESEIRDALRSVDHAPSGGGGAAPRARNPGRAAERRSDRPGL